MALNPFPLIGQCHRVVGSVFKLGEYGDGLDVKLEISVVKAETTHLSGKSQLLTRSF
jgi:O6-methylguanine-DNA--protein-cysteine methyltransferase